MKPLNEVGCPEMILLFIPVIIYGIYINWKAKGQEQKRQEEVKKQNRNGKSSNKSSIYDEYDKKHRWEYDAVKRVLNGQGVVPPSKDNIVEVTDTVPDIVEDKVQDIVSLDDIEEEMAKIKNIAPNPRDTTWFLCTHKDLPAPSVTETEIITALEKYSIKWVREVSFKGLQFTTYSYPRFDFYLPDYNIIIEYDGQYAHSTKQQLATDKAKDMFCKNNNIRVIRYNRKHYYNLQSHVCSLMKELKVKKRN